MMLAQYRSRVGAKLGLTNDADANPTLIDAWVNEGYEDVLLRTRCKVRRATIALTSGTYDYSLPTGVLTILELYNTSASVDYPMERLSLQELLERRRATGTAPARYYTTDGDLLTLYPTPGTGESLTVYYTPRPTALSATADSPTDIPAEFHKLLEWYALVEGAEYDQSAGNGLTSLARYENGIKMLRKYARLRGGTRLAPIPLGRRRRYAQHDPSADVRW